MSRYSKTLALMIVGGLTACSGPGGDRPDGPPGGGPGGGAMTRPVLSPNAEPLSGGPLGPRPCAEVLSAWAERIDTDPDGMISRQEFLADAQGQFARMDLDHDGTITSDELTTYREPFRPKGPPAGKSGPHGERDGGGAGQSGGPGGGGPGGGAGLPGNRSGGMGGESQNGGGPGGGRGGRISTTGSSGDPVMSADTNLDFKVSLDEFLIQANATFDTLDSDHSGMVGHDEILRRCKDDDQERDKRRD